WSSVHGREGMRSSSEMRYYDLMLAVGLDSGVPKGARFGVFRSSTHNPSAEVLDSGDLDPLLVAVGRNMGHYDDPMVVLTPNAYFDDHNTDGLTNIRRIEQRCIDKFNFRPVIALGEYGYDQGITSEHGWRAAGINGAQAVQKMIDQYHAHLEGFAACGYGVGFSEAAKVWTFHFDTAELKLLASL